ncbi:MAG TPA: peptide deformylase [Acidimicrobiales bacterium]|nr:peptide deformylase [Acidimicrobiales bacterium]
MTIRVLRLLGDPVLRTRATEVTDFDRSLSRLVGDLTDTLRDANGAGLAAPQLGVGLRVFVYALVDPDDPERFRYGHLVNPVLVDQSAEQIDDEEGCLSIPGLSYTLARPRRLVARGLDMHGEPVEVEGTERLARCLAHETDHLDGVLFIDRLEGPERKRALREVRELLDAGEDVTVKTSPHAPVVG